MGDLGDSESADVPISFGQRLRSERERLGFNQLEFSDLGGIKRSSQILYESGRRVPDVRYLEKIKVAGVDLIYLVTGEYRVQLPADALVIRHATLTAMYKLVDELCKDGAGNLFPTDVRLRFFQMMCASVAHLHGNEADVNALRAQFALFTQIE